VYKFSKKIQEPPQNSRCQNSDIKQAPYYTDDPQTLGATLQNLVTQETWYSGFVHPSIRWLFLMFYCLCIRGLSQK